MNDMNTSARRYDIDWLRNLAFLVLILYHIGMYYVLDWGWHIKSDTTFRWLQEVMILTNPWRMSLLFFISAMALALVTHRYRTSTLFRKRTSRLMLPLLFGMFVIVVPQVYIEALSQNLIEPGYFTFWQSYIDPNTELLREHHSSIGLLTWNHLWFLPYLWLYSLIVIACAPLLRYLTQSAPGQQLSPWIACALLIISYTVIRYGLRPHFPETHGLTDDWYNHARYFLVFVAGYTLVLLPQCWQRVIDMRRLFLVLAVSGYLFLIADRNGGFETLATLYYQTEWVKGLYNLISSINHWCWILACVGYAGRYLNRPSAILKYTNKAILPWYMFHQTLIVMLAWYFKPFGIAPWAEFLLILLGTISGCAIGYEIVKRVPVLRQLCGLSAAVNTSAPHAATLSVSQAK